MNIFSGLKYFVDTISFYQHFYEVKDHHHLSCFPADKWGVRPMRQLADHSPSQLPTQMLSCFTCCPSLFLFPYGVSSLSSARLCLEHFAGMFSCRSDSCSVISTAINRTGCGTVLGKLQAVRGWLLPSHCLNFPPSLLLFRPNKLDTWTLGQKIKMPTYWSTKVRLKGNDLPSSSSQCSSGSSQRV